MLLDLDKRVFKSKILVNGGGVLGCLLNQWQGKHEQNEVADLETGRTSA
jgi:hypothetical protein